MKITAPGRINLIGEHTDYNDGFVFPAAIDRAVKAEITRNHTRSVNLRALDINEKHTFSLDDEVVPVLNGGWINYFLGVVKPLLDAGKVLDGFDFEFSSTVPVGSGLSSSAALESSFVLALNSLFGLNLTDMEMARLGQLAEHTFVGVKCGIMDQFASIHGKKDHALKLDCRSLEFNYFPLDLGDYQIMLFNSRVHHSLAASAYNERRHQCEEGAARLSNHFQKGSHLRDFSLHELNDIKDTLDPDVYTRCRFVIEENGRVHQAADALKQHDLITFGHLMRLSHKGLSEKFEVSCKELDLLTGFVKDEDAVLGARMMGGGFGGCTINLIKKSDTERIVEQVTVRYKEETGIDPETYLVQVSDGARVV